MEARMHAIIWARHHVSAHAYICSAALCGPLDSASTYMARHMLAPHQATNSGGGCGCAPKMPRTGTSPSPVRESIHPDARALRVSPVAGRIRRRRAPCRGQ